MKKFIEAVKVIVVITIFALLVGLLVNYQFGVYQKKHGSQMTFTDFIFDAERK